MARKKTAKNVLISPWLSGRLDCKEGRFIQVGNSLLLSEAFQKLTASARLTYFALALEGGGKKTVTFSHGAAKKYGITPSTYDRTVKQLRDAGFIEVIGDPNLNQFKANEYRFCSRWKSYPAPQNGEGHD